MTLSSHGSCRDLPLHRKPRIDVSLIGGEARVDKDQGVLLITSSNGQPPTTLDISTWFNVRRGDVHQCPKRMSNAVTMGRGIVFTALLHYLYLLFAYFLTDLDASTEVGNPHSRRPPIHAAPALPPCPRCYHWYALSRWRQPFCTPHHSPYPRCYHWYTSSHRR